MDTFEQREVRSILWKAFPRSLGIVLGSITYVYCVINPHEDFFGIDNHMEVGQ